MLRSFAILQVVGFVFVTVVGTLMHFFYEWSGRNRVVGLFCPVSESTWEHLKLLFFPSVVYSGIEYLCFGRWVRGFVPASSMGILLGLLMIVVAFYTYTGIVGRNFLVADIGVFILGVAVEFYFVWRAVPWQLPVPLLAVPAIPVLAVCFWVFTFWPPRIGLFKDPTAGKTRSNDTAGKTHGSDARGKLKNSKA